MVALVALALLFLFLLVVAVLVTKGDWGAPPVVISVMFFLCTAAGVYNAALHGVGVSIEACVLLLAVTGWFCAVSFLSYRAVLGNAGADRPSWIPQEACIVVPRWILVGAVLFSLVVIVLYYRDLTSTFNALGVSGNWNEQMNQYRFKSSFRELDEGEGISGFVSLLYKIQTALTFVFVYIGVHNIVVGDKLVHQVALLPPVVAFAACTIMSSGRMALIRMVFGCLIVAWVLYNARTGWRKRIKISSIFAGFAVLIIASIAFWAAGAIVGRQISAGPLDYITSYIGYSETLFSMFLADASKTASGLFGSETLNGVYNFIGSHFGIEEFIYTNHLEWRYIGDLSLGNVYTAYRYWLNDFGYIGMFMVAALYAVFYSVFYAKVRCYKKSRFFNCPLLAYSYFAYGLFLVPIKDCLLATELVVTTPFVLIGMYILARYIESKQQDGVGASTVNGGRAITVHYPVHMKGFTS